jgi:hypothetical protein
MEVRCYQHGLLRSVLVENNQAFAGSDDNTCRGQMAAEDIHAFHRVLDFRTCRPQFNHWTVRTLAGFDGRGQLLVCLCSCYKVRAVRLTSLRSGASKSCGCRGRLRGRPRYLELTDSDRQEILERWEDGKNPKSIAQLFRLTYVRVLKNINEIKV